MAKWVRLHPSEPLLWGNALHPFDFQLFRFLSCYFLFITQKRHTFVWRFCCASFLSTHFGGGGGSRTPVRKRFLGNLSGRRRSFTFPCPVAGRQAKGLGSFMIHGALKALRTHGHHSTTPHPGSWSFRAGRSRLKPRQAQRYRCSLIYKLPILRMLGASARYSRLRVPVETSTPPRRRKLHIPRFRPKGESSLISLRLLFQTNPLALGFVWRSGASEPSSSRRSRLRWASPGEGRSRYASPLPETAPEERAVQSKSVELSAKTAVRNRAIRFRRGGPMWPPVSQGLSTSPARGSPRRRSPR